MANNCLVTKLKDTVDNSNLLKLGQALFSTENDHFDPTFGFYVFISGAVDTVTITPVTPVCYAAKDIDILNLPAPIVGPTTINTEHGYFSVYIPDGGEWLLDNYYTAITSCLGGRGGLSIDTFNYLTEFNGDAQLYKGALSKIKLSQLPKVMGLLDIGLNVVNDADIMPIIAAAVNCVNVYCIGYDKPCTAELFGAVLNTNVTRFIGPRYNAQFSGTIEGFVAAQRAKGRTTGSIEWFHGGSLTTITFDGVPIGEAWDTITWTASTITFLGKTINA